MKHFILPILCTMAMAAQAKDTIRVERVGVKNPITITADAPYQTDSLDNKGNKFSATILNDHATRAFALQEVITTLESGVALEAVDSMQTLRVLQFGVRSNRYAKATLNIKNLKNYRVFVNGRAGSTALTMTPGHYDVRLVCLHEKESKDSVNISVIGENLEGIEVNPISKRPYLMAEMMQGKRTYNARISPSGKYLVTYYQHTMEDGKNFYRTVLSETESQRTIASYGSYVDYNWVRTQDVLYFTRTNENGKELVLLDPATMKETVLANGLPDGGFTLAPTLDYLIITKSQDGKKPSGSLKQLQHPDDRMPGYRSRSSLWRYDLKERRMQRLTFGNTNLSLQDISNDGTKLLLMSSTMEPSRVPYRRYSLYVMNALTAKVDTVLADTAWLSSAKFSPDASQLLINASTTAFNNIGLEVKPGQHPNTFDHRLYLHDIAMGSTKPLLPGYTPSVDNYSWHPTNGFIYITAADGSNRSIWQLNPKTLEVVKFDMPLSFVSSFSYASLQKVPTAIILGQDGGERAREMFRVTLNPKKIRAQRIGEVNFDELYKDVAIGTCHDWKFQSSRGDSVQGFYYLPANFDATKKYPLIVYYYGGCTPSNKLLEINYPYQVFASLGYVVYVVQPSGALGFGQEFAARHTGTWGDMSSDDIIEGTKQFCKEHEFINTEKIGCIGASYGGFMTQYLQTKTDIFAAAISHAGISNIASYWGGGYWGYTYGEVAQYGSFPWNNPDLYTKHSPLFNADKIKTPLLLIHGTVDTNVPPFESQQLFTALRILGKEVAYIQVNGEDHVITNWQKRHEWQNAIFAWFAKYLKGQPEWWEAIDK